MRARRRTHHSHVAWFRSDEEFQSQTPRPAWDRICTERKQTGLPNTGMVQILGYSGNSTDRPHASTVGIRSVVGPIAGSGTLEAVPAQPVEPVRVRLASQELSGEFSHSLQALAPLQRPVMEAECGPDQGS